MFDIRYHGLRLVPSKAALQELMRYGFMLADCKLILEQGYSPRKRKKDVVERWYDEGNKTYNVVAVLSFSHFYCEDVYLVTHIGKFTRKKLRK